MLSKVNCLYTNKIYDCCNFYIKEGILLKNRNNKFTTLENEIKNYNNIAIEENGIIKIYCNKERVIIYDKIIDSLKKYCLSIEKYIKIFIK